MIDGIAPSIPTGITATPGSGRVLLKWDKNTESDIGLYKVYRSEQTGFTPSSDNLIASFELDSTTIVWLDQNLVNGELYFYLISAVDKAGNESAYSSEVFSIPNPQSYKVKLDGSGDFTSIQSAVNYSLDGDTISIYTGEYKENVVIKDKILTVLANDSDGEIILNGQNIGRPLTLEGSTGLLLEGLTLTQGVANGVGRIYISSTGQTV